MSLYPLPLLLTHKIQNNSEAHLFEAEAPSVTNSELPDPDSDPLPTEPIPSGTQKELSTARRG